MTLEEIIKQKESDIAAIPEKLLTDVQRAEKGIFVNMILLLDRIKRDSEGKIIISKSNIAIAADITNELKTILVTKDYLTALKEFAAGFDAQAQANDEYFSKVFPDFQNSAAADAMLQKAKTTALDQLLGAPVEKSYIVPLTKMIDTAVSSGSGWVELSNQIKDFVLGNSEVEGKLASHASQVAYDSFAFADRAYTNIISEENDAEWYLWSGTHLATSRPFCDERKDKFFHYKEIESWAQQDWEGKADGTNEQTIFILAGGYRCVDSILPVSVSVVPQDVIERNIANGNYQPTGIEAELLGI